MKNTYVPHGSCSRTARLACPSPLVRLLHVALPTIFLGMTLAFVTIPYQLGKWPANARISDMSSANR